MEKVGLILDLNIKGSVHKMVVQLAMLYGMETAPMTSSHV